MKICSMCKEEKEPEGFYKQVKGLMGLTAECKDCRKKRTFGWKCDNREHVKKYSKETYAKHKKEANRKYREANPDYMKKYRLKKKLNEVATNG